MWRSVLLGVVLAGALAACSLGGASGPSQGSTSAISASYEGYTGKSAVLFDYAYGRCYTLAHKAATVKPFGSDPKADIYPLTRARPIAAIGTVKPHGHAEMTAVLRGCAAAMVTAFADVHSSHTALVCKIQKPFLPATITACKGS